MSVARVTPITASADCMPGSPAEIIDLATMRPLPNEEGVFVSPLPTYDTVVDESKRRVVSTDRYPGYGTVWIEEWAMSDGTRNDILLGAPERRLTDIPVVKDTAWTTQVEGFNLDVARQLMQLGFPVVIKGPEKNTSIPLSHSAHNTHQVLDAAEKIGFHEHKVAAVEGFSRGAMIALGTLAYSAANDRKIIYANLTDPRMANPLEPTLSTAKEWATSAPSHALACAVQMGLLAMNPIRAWHYRHSVDISVNGAKQVYRTGKAIFNGEAGTLARHVPSEAQMLICFFGKKVAPDQQPFEEILDNHPGVEFRRLKSAHIAGMDKKILGNIAARFSGLAKQLADGVQPNDIDYSLIHKTSS